MKRDHFTLQANPAPDDPDRKPTLRIAYDGSTAPLRERLRTGTGEQPAAEHLDIGFRLQDGEQGVISVADRQTGAFICEINAAAEEIEAMVEAAETDDKRYRIELVLDDDILTSEKQTLLVYDEAGQLLRNASLIPNSVEI